MTLEQLLRDAPADCPVCTVTGSTKNMELQSIMAGARDFDAVSRSVKLCQGNGCAAVNKSGRGCRENVAALLEIYVPIYDLIFEGGGCHHHKEKPAACESGQGCGSCRLCGDK